MTASMFASQRPIVWRVLMFAVAVPAVLIAIDPWRRPMEAPSLLLGIGLGVAGAATVMRSLSDRHAAGVSAGESRLVTAGLYAHTRHPLYLGVLSLLSGLAMSSRSPLLGLYLLAAIGGLAWRSIVDERRLSRAQLVHWGAYRDRTARWIPWRGGRR